MTEPQKAERDAFEKWATGNEQHFDLSRRRDNSYYSDSTDYAWLSWQAAFEAGRSAREQEKNECAVCHAALLPDESIPHCEDCIVTDEVEQQYLEARDAR